MSSRKGKSPKGKGATAEELEEYDGDLERLRTEEEPAAAPPDTPTPGRSRSSLVGTPIPPPLRPGGLTRRSLLEPKKKP